LSEWSEGGSEILRHDEPERQFELAPGDATLIDAVSAHLERHVPGEQTVWHELVSDLVHVDVHSVPPGPGRDWTTLVTSGMAERPMDAPEPMLEYRFAELTMALPPDWPLTQEALEDEASSWPVELIKFLARMPRLYETFLYHGHTVPNGNPPEPLGPSTELCCAFLAPPRLGPDGFDRIELPDGRTVHVHAIVPIYRDEMDLKLKKGADTLQALFDERGVTELIDPARPTVAPPKRGLFRR
jgi:hypothetical protein